MRLSPLDIRKQDFSKGFRGYDPAEVQAFLQMMATQWSEVQEEQRRQEDEINNLKNKLAHYERVEEALQEALQIARESTRRAIDSAEQRAQMIIDDAEQRASEITRQAELSRHQLKNEAANLSNRRNEIVARLRAFLLSEMEVLAHYEGDDPIGFIKLLPSDQGRLGAARESTAYALPEHDAPPETPDIAPPHEAEAPAIVDVEAEPIPSPVPASFAPPEPVDEPADAPPAIVPDLPVADAEPLAADDEPASAAEEHAELQPEETAPPEATAEPEPAPEEPAKPWVKRSVFAAPSSSQNKPEQPRVTASLEEIEKIQRILEDL
ncbi:MAG: hypothetical protein RhofKO_20340 [Rhodothermales bacterium]